MLMICRGGNQLLRINYVLERVLSTFIVTRGAIIMIVNTGSSKPIPTRGTFDLNSTSICRHILPLI